MALPQILQKSLKWLILAFMNKSKLKTCEIKAVFSEENYAPQPSSFVGYIENYGIKLWRPFKQQYSIGRNGHRPKCIGPKWSWTKMVMGRNDPEPLYNMSCGVRKQTFCICENKDVKLISVFVFAKWIVQSLYFLNLKFQWSSSLL